MAKRNQAKAIELENSENLKDHKSDFTRNILEILQMHFFSVCEGTNLFTRTMHRMVTDNTLAQLKLLTVDDYIDAQFLGAHANKLHYPYQIGMSFAFLELYKTAIKGYIAAVQLLYRKHGHTELGRKVNEDSLTELYRELVNDIKNITPSNELRHLHDDLMSFRKLRNNVAHNQAFTVQYSPRKDRTFEDFLKKLPGVYFDPRNSWEMTYQDTHERMQKGVKGYYIFTRPPHEFLTSFIDLVSRLYQEFISVFCENLSSYENWQHGFIPPKPIPLALDNYLTAYNRFDVEGMLAQLHTDIVFENYSGDQCTHRTVGKNAFRIQANDATKMFTERRQTAYNWRETRVHDSNHGSDKTREGFLADIHYRGVLAVDLPDGALAGSTIELKGTAYFEVIDGLICKIVDRS